MNKLPADRVPITEFGSLGTAIRSHYKAFGIEIHIFALQTDLAPYAMLSVAVDQTGQGPAIAIGLGCHLNPATAIRKSLLEVCQAHHVEAWNWSPVTLSEKPNSHIKVRSPLDHSALFAHLEMVSELDFFLNARTIRADLNNRSKNPSCDLDLCLESLKESGIRVFYLDLTTPDVAAFGFSVVRVLTSGLQPIHFGFRNERLGAERLYQLPRLLGYTAEDTNENRLNRCPHPLS